MNKIIIEEKNYIIKKEVIDFIIHMIGYALVLILISILFNEQLSLDYSYFGIWALFASIIIYILNKTIKPILIVLTLPVTAYSLGIFYPFINIFILYIVSLLLGSHFNIAPISSFGGIISLFFMAVFISLMNFLMDKKIVEPLLKKVR